MDAPNPWQYRVDKPCALKINCSILAPDLLPIHDSSSSYDDDSVDDKSGDNSVDGVERCR